MYGLWVERPLPEEFQYLLQNIAEVVGSGAADTPEFEAESHKVHAIIASASTRFDRAYMEKVPTLKVISRTGIGVDNIDLAAATERNIAICNAPSVPTNPTAEHAITLMMVVTKHLKQAEKILHQEGRLKGYFSQHRGIELEGATLGIIGLGRIGKKTAQKALGLGMNVMAYDPFISSTDNPDIELATTLEALLQNADVVSLHLPSTPETRHIINAERLAQMKAGSYLINAARGQLVDEKALLNALESGHLAGAGLDVFDPEPPATDNPLLHRDDVFVSPHIGGVTVESRNRFWQEAISQAMQVLRDERPPNLVNTDLRIGE